MKKKILVFCVFIFSLKVSGQDPFLKYLDGKSPQIIKEISSKDTLGIIVREVTFKFNDSSEVYAVIASPQKNGKYPGMLVLHGGGGLAEKDKAVAWAQRGYIAVAPDLPGIAEPSKLTYTKGRWNKLKYGDKRWIAKPDVSSSVIFDAVVCAMKSLYLLQSQPKIDRNKIGVVGVSWGGYMTTMVCGLAGNQVKAGFSVYGCGFYELTSSINNFNKMPQNEMEQWLKNLDAGRRTKNMKANYFVAGATNDFFYYPKAVQKTLDSIPLNKNHVFAPNVNHTMPIPGGSIFEVNASEKFVPTEFQPYPTPKGSKANWMSMEVIFIDYILKGVGKPLPSVTVQPSNDISKGKFEIDTPEKITKVEVYYSSNCKDVKTCEWKVLTPTDLGKNNYEVILPIDYSDWFVLVSDIRPVSVSSNMISR